MLWENLIGFEFLKAIAVELRIGEKKTKIEEILHVII